MVLISHEYKFIFIKNIKVAGTSVEAFFEKYCVDPDVKYAVESNTDEKISKYGIIGSREQGKFSIWFNHINAASIKKNIGDKIFNSYFKFCVVRNPYDKMVSYFHWRGHKYNENLEEMKKEFKEFCKIHNCNNMYLFSINGKPICDYYIKYENLFEDIEEVCKKLKIKNYLPIVLNNYKSETRSVKIDYRKYYDNETREIVYRNHMNEINFFGYQF